MERIMIVDMLNMYYRAYIVDPSLSTNGQPIGGIKGSIRILQKLCREIKPTKVFICWDGREGSTKRKAQKGGYKEGRKKPLRLNRDVAVLNAEEEIQNKIWQQSRLMEYFNTLPVSQILIEHMEADDVIAVLCGLYKDAQKVIISSDKDFFQLLDDTTVLYRPVQKEILNKKAIVEKFNIHPTNFTLARAMAGDKSDNIEGIGGVGLKSAAKRFPFLKEEKSYSISHLVEYGKKMLEESDLKIYNSVVEQKELLAENYKIMQLYCSSASPSSERTIKEAINNYPLELNKTEMIKMMIQDGFAEISFDELFAHMRNIKRTNNEL
jgi:DNA polymerase-1|tara:strand:+ start:1521 stop:2489 length:969 start_codon:yes stop_codon:yes gene_type:complete